jgi:CHAD domain-containing protein
MAKRTTPSASSPKGGKRGKVSRVNGTKPRLHFLKEKSFGKELRKLASLQLEAALHELKGNNVSPDAVHNARTYIKKVRSILQLAAPSLPRALREELLHQLGEAAARMAPLRDAEVHVQTLDHLLEKAGIPTEPLIAIRAGLADVAKQRRINDARRIPKVIASLRSVRDSIPEWPLDDLGAKDLYRRIRRTYRRGRTALDLCSTTDDPEEFHLWRKLVKQLWYQLRITAPYWPRKGEELITASGRIGHLAGIERDYTLLAATLAKGPKSKASKLLQETISDLLPRLRQQAMKAGERFYAEKPKSFIRDLGL